MKILYSGDCDHGVSLAQDCERCSAETGAKEEAAKNRGFKLGWWSATIFWIFVVVALVLAGVGCSSPYEPEVLIETVEVHQVGDSLRVTWIPNVAYKSAILRMSGPLPTNGELREIVSRRFDGRHVFTVALFDYLEPDDEGLVKAWVAVTLCRSFTCEAPEDRVSYFVQFQTEVTE